MILVFIFYDVLVSWHYWFVQVHRRIKAMARFRASCASGQFSQVSFLEFLVMKTVRICSPCGLCAQFDLHPCFGFAQTSTTVTFKVFFVEFSLESYRFCFSPSSMQCEEIIFLMCSWKIVGDVLL